MNIQFRRAKIGKPNKRFRFGRIYTIDLGFFIIHAHNNGTEIGFVSWNRIWYSVLFGYNRFNRFVL